MKLQYLLRSAVGLLLALAWAARAEQAPRGDTIRSGAETEYFAVFIGGKKIGRAMHTRVAAGKKVTTTESLQMTISRLGQTMTVSVEETFTETADGKPVSFRFVSALGAIPVRVEGTIVEGNKIKVTRTVGQTKQQQTVNWPEGAMMSEGARLQTREMGLKEGTTYARNLFDAMSMAAVETKVQIGPAKNVDLLGRVVKLTEIRTTTTVSTLMGPVRVEGLTYVDKDFKAQKSVIPMLGEKIELVACSKEFALSKDDVVDFLEKLILTSPAALTARARAKSITYHLAPTGEKRISIPTIDSQTVRTGRDRTLIVTVRASAAVGRAKFPYTGKDKTALEAVKPTRFLQSDDKEVIALARKAVGDADDAAEAVRRIESFVRKHVNKKDLSVGYATAAEVAKSRQGDCSEHAVLAAAMCRAVGIPAQVVMGLVYAERLGQKRHIFGPHAWVQALVGEKWVGLDPTTSGFDAGHIALAVGNGNPESFFQILGNLGLFKIARAEAEQ